MYDLKSISMSYPYSLPQFRPWPSCAINSIRMEAHKNSSKIAKLSQDQNHIEDLQINQKIKKTIIWDLKRKRRYLDRKIRSLSNISHKGKIFTDLDKNRKNGSNSGKLCTFLLISLINMLIIVIKEYFNDFSS